jgi:hypothetical protein
MKRTQVTKERKPLSSQIKVSGRAITITLLSPDVGATHITYPLNGLVLDTSMKVQKTPWEISGAMIPAVFRVEGFLSDSSPVSFRLTLDYTDDSKPLNEAVRVSKIEADDDASLTPSLLKDIALNTVRAECLRLVAVRVRLFPAGKWEMADFPHPAKPNSTWYIEVEKGKVEVGQVFRGADAKDSKAWALSLSGKRVSAWDSDDVLNAVVRLFNACPPKEKNRAQWIAEQLEREGFVSTRGDSYKASTVNTQIKKARQLGLIAPTTRKKITK